MNATEPLRHVCMFCKKDLPGSATTAEKVSHGACKPFCKEAEAWGWKEKEKNFSTAGLNTPLTTEIKEAA